jgi:hypothetical protein
MIKFKLYIEIHVLVLFRARLGEYNRDSDKNQNAEGKMQK